MPREMNLTELETLARRATPGSYASVDFDLPSDEDCRFHAACSPETILALLALAKIAVSRKDQIHAESCPGNHPAYCDCGVTAALKGVSL